MRKKILKSVMCMTLATTLVSCGISGNDEAFDLQREITVVSREEGSGTRGAFVEMFGILEKDGDNEYDRTYEEAIISNKTDVVMTTVSNDRYGVGYISLGSMNETLKAVSVEGVEASVENILNGTYEIYRPFLVLTKDDSNELANDFISFIESEEGQEIVGSQYVSANLEAESYQSTGVTGKLTVGGSTSVSPIMEKLAEAYIEKNPDVTIDIQATGSSAGISGTIEGTLDIGMSSRDLKDDEMTEVTPVEIAFDGLAIIVNTENPINDLSKEEVKKIFTGEITTWEEVYE